jgi:hypothetical protein
MIKKLSQSGKLNPKKIYIQKNLWKHGQEYYYLKLKLKNYEKSRKKFY